MAGYGKRRGTRARRTAVSRPVAERVEVKCGLCQGTGKDRWGLMSVLSNCQVCRGKGTVRIEEPYEKCPVCQGAGFERNKRVTCLACKGKGVIHIKEEGMQTCPDSPGGGAKRVALREAAEARRPERPRVGAQAPGPRTA